MAGKPTRALDTPGTRSHAATLSGLDACSRNDRAAGSLPLASTAAHRWARRCGNTDSWVDAHAADGWPAQYGDAANSSYIAVRRRRARSRCDWTPLGQGRPRRAGSALGSGGYLAANAQTPGGCSLMVWENDNNGPPALVQPAVAGRRLRPSPLFDGFDNLYVGQPGAMLSFPPTQWIRWRQPVIGMPTTPRILGARPAAGGHAPRSGAGVRRPPRHGGRHAAGSRGGRRPHRCAARAAPTASPARPRCPVAAAPAFSPATGRRGARAVAARRPGARRWSG